MNHCSKLITCKMFFKIECVHCNAINYVTQDYDAKYDFEEITCWSCNHHSLTDESFLEFYPEYPNESVGGGSLEGKPSPD